MSLAAKLFETTIAHDKAEADVIEMLWSIYGVGGYDEFTHDHYDESIEVYDCTPSAAAYDRLAEIGYARIWQHPHPQEGFDRTRCGCKSARPT